MQQKQDLNNQSFDLMIEVTRRCNLTCAHCLRGDAQNVDFKPSDLRKFLENNKVEHINDLAFTGGEPFLKPKIIEECVDILKDLNIDVNMSFIATNGTVLNFGALKAIAAVDSLVEELTIKVSNSPYHQESINELGLYANYSLEEILWDLDEEKQEELLYYPYAECNFSEINIYKESEKGYTLLIDQGRAAENGISGRDMLPITEEGASFFVSLTANGFVNPDYCDYSFDTANKSNLKPIDKYKINWSDYIIED